ncbi:MAG: hypothetical protein PHY44_00100 [Lachnospiraceae bacterium]|nr:hypothetical protein [Lachnospiraceae bacterium]
MNDSFNRKRLYFYIIALIIFKLIIVGGLPIYSVAFAAHDDFLMVDMAKNILEGNWLGMYSQMTFIKGVFFPLFLSTGYLLNIPLPILQTIFYALSCIVFIFGIKTVLKNDYLKAFIFTVLFFAPITTATNTFLRVYRCNITPAQILFLSGCLFGMYFSRNGKTKDFIKWAIGAGFALATLWHTREDGIWVMPLVLAVISITIITYKLDNNVFNIKLVIQRSCISIIPLLIFILFSASISVINYNKYGIYIYNELNQGNFPRLIKDIYRIQPAEDIYRTSVPKSTIDRIYEVSPTFASLKETLDSNYGGGWDATDGELDGQIKDGWFFWCLRDVVYANGYYADPIKADEFYRDAADEIETALENGKLEKREGVSMPSALMSPFKYKYISEIFPAMGQAYMFIAKNDVGDTQLIQSVGDENKIRIFENISRSFAIYPSKTRIDISGWFLCNDGNRETKVLLYKNDDFIKEFKKVDSPDISSYFSKSLGLRLENAQKCRFSENLYIDEVEEYKLVFQVDGKTIQEIGVDESNNIYGFNTGDTICNIDNMKITKAEDTIASTNQNKIKLINTITTPYHKLGFIAFIVGYMGYVLLTIYIIYTLIKYKKSKMVDEWLILTGLAGSMLVLIAGVSYTHISAYYAITSLYLSAAFPLNISFIGLSCIFMTRALKDKNIKNIKN